jgi:tetratricopeptide (TPR) repeat protein
MNEQKTRTNNRKEAGEKWFFLLFVLFLLLACVSPLRESKTAFVRGRESRALNQKAEAQSWFKRARIEARRECLRRPSAQAFMLRGLAEMELKLWGEAVESFRTAFSLGFSKGEEWADAVTLYGLGAALEEMGLERTALKMFGHLLERSKFRPVCELAAGRYTDRILGEALEKDKKERGKMLQSLLKRIERLSDKDLSCGFYHYLQAQVLFHLKQTMESFEQSVLAKELGLPSAEVSRDNDIQITVCYRELTSVLPAGERERFEKIYAMWINKWKWPDPLIPDWKEK